MTRPKGLALQRILRETHITSTWIRRVWIQRMTHRGLSPSLTPAVILSVLSSQCRGSSGLIPFSVSLLCASNEQISNQTLWLYNTTFTNVCINLCLQLSSLFYFSTGSVEVDQGAETENVICKWYVNIDTFFRIFNSKYLINEYYIET